MQQPLHSPDMQPANPPFHYLHPPPNSWLFKCLIHRVTNSKPIFLKRLLLYQLTARQHFYFGKYLREFLRLGATRTTE